MKIMACRFSHHASIPFIPLLHTRLHPKQEVLCYLSQWHFALKLEMWAFSLVHHPPLFLKGKAHTGALAAGHFMKVNTVGLSSILNSSSQETCWNSINDHIWWMLIERWVVQVSTFLFCPLKKSLTSTFIILEISIWYLRVRLHGLSGSPTLNSDYVLTVIKFGLGVRKQF